MLGCCRYTLIDIAAAIAIAASKIDVMYLSYAEHCKQIILIKQSDIGSILMAPACKYA